MSNSSKAMARIAALVDENSFVETGSMVTARSTDFDLKNTDTPSDGVVTGHGLIDGNLVFIYSQDPDVLGGSIGEMHAKKIAGVYNNALKMGAPVIGIIDSTGMRVQETVDALEAVSKIYAKQTMASGVIPQIACVYGSCGGGMAVMASLCDFTFAVKDSAKIFVNSPDSIKGNFEGKCDTSSAAFQASEVGTVDFEGTEAEINAKVRELISLIPASNAMGGLKEECIDDMNRGCASLDVMKADPRFLLPEISDSNIFFEKGADFAPEMVTGFIKLGGTTVGAVAQATAKYDENGTKAEEYENRISANAANKAADFINFCDSFDIPVVSFVNTVGFSACCICNEKKLAKALANLTFAFANATVPKVNFITGDAFSSAYSMMNSRSLGADVVYAYPSAKVGMMEPKLAAQVMCPDADAAKLAEVTKELTEVQSSVDTAAKRGYVDRIVDYADTRKYLIDAFEMLYTKNIEQPYKKHGTV